MTQCINTGLAPVVLLKNIHSINSYILALAYWGIYSQKKVHKSLSNYRYSNPALHSATPLSAWGSYDYEKLGGVPHNVAEVLPICALQKRQGMESKNG